MQHARPFTSLLVTLLIVVACGDNHELSPDAHRPACSDGADNDGDGTIDFPDDLGCESRDDETEDSVVAPACNDKRDNDGDGKLDYPDDPGCNLPQSDTELDDCPTGLGCPACSDRMDNDGNGKTDYPGDPGCASAADAYELAYDATACGAGMTIKDLPLTGLDLGTLKTTSTSQLTSPCGGGGGAPAIAYVFHLSQPKVLIATTDLPGTVVDTVLDLRSAICDAPTAHVACNDDIGTNNTRSTLVRPLQPGTYYLIVQSSAPTESGSYWLSTELLPGQGTGCTTTADCGPGLVCRIPVGSTVKVCSPPVCSDTIDDDGDGKLDYPNDPGCAGPEDATESDVCATAPTDPACPLCGNGLDDDGDGQTDYPGDPTCVAASSRNEACAQSEPLIVATQPLTTGTTAGAANDFTPPPGNYNGHACSTTGTHSAPDRAIQLDVPAMSSLSLRLNPVSFNSSHVLLGASCAGMPIDCHDNPTSMVLSSVAAGRYYLIVDGYSTASGTFTLNVSGTIANGGSCEAPLAQSGALACGPGYACRGVAGSRMCQPAECNDGVDNNGTGGIDYPADPGCTSKTDNSEDTVCPGVSCPKCADGLDNDGDTLIDYPADTGCVAASADNEGCAEVDPITPITAPTTNGTLVGASNDHDPSCVATNLPDKIFTLDVPTALQSLVIDTEGSVVDTVLSFMNMACAEPSIACDDDGGVGTGDSLITRGFVPAGSYTIAVDSDTATLDTFVLHVAGTILPGGSCEGALFQAGVLACPLGFGCNGTPGSRKCTAAQCQDGADNNVDGKIDYPDDPGCDSASDNSEATVCPGAACPECSDGLDNDGDGDIDYPADDGCEAASGTSEGCIDLDPIAPITSPTTTGTLVGASDDHDPACVTTNGTDRLFTLAVPVTLQSLTIDTNGSVVDTALSFMTSACEEPSLACDDDGGAGTGDSLITRSFVAPGLYTIAVDADTTTPNTFVLHVAGAIVPGGSCEDPLVAAGVLTCSIGFACSGPVGARTCTLAQCQDGVDNNGDSKIDYPDDPGCDSPSDNSETTVCPGLSCPACSDGLDNDGDGDIDYPGDDGCAAASGAHEGCIDLDPIAPITSPTTTGTLVGASDDHDPACVTTNGTDRIFTLDVPATLQSLTIDTEGSIVDTALSFMTSACEEPSLACDDDSGVGTGDSLITRSFVAPGLYTIAVDADTTTPNTFILNVAGVIAPGGSCESPLVAAGVLACSTGFACSGPVGARTCGVAECLDGFDNNLDGRIDFPDDPGCETFSDSAEDTVCPGAACPVCSDGVDNDADGTADYPFDPSCFAASGTTEACTQSEPVDVITQPVTTGTTIGQSNDYAPTCGSATAHSAPDVALQLDVPGMATLRFSFTGFTSGLHTVLNATCGGTPLACNTTGPTALANLTAGTYYVVIDGVSTTSGPWTLTTSGTVAPGESCEGALFQSGAFTCTSGFSCAGPMGARTCMPLQCTDGIDNNGDGAIDYPFDPGCATPSDDSETTVCPGAGCPVCSNAADDDADMQADFPADFGCSGAGATTEVFCAVETTPATVITMRQTAGSLAAPATDNYEQSCQTNTGNDRAYALRLPVPVTTLVVDTLGSTIADTVVSVWDASCGVQLGCDDDDAPGTDNRSLLTLTYVRPGNYAIQVDGFSTSNAGNFLLNVRGTVAAGTACTSPLFTTGVLACPPNTTCTAGTCQ
jgi:large repetitive protein